MSRIAIVLPSATYRSHDFVEAARGLGMSLTVISEERQLLLTDDDFLLIDCDQPAEAAERIAALHARSPLSSILAADDQGVLVAALGAERIGLPHNPPEAVAATRNKVMLRRALRGIVRQPVYQVLEKGVDAAEVARLVRYPVVMKPLSLSGSRGVIRCDNDLEARAADSRIRMILATAGANPNEPLLIERYVPGIEIAVEGVLQNGELTVLAVLDKPDPLVGPYFEETIYTAPSQLHPEMIEEVNSVVADACAALGLVVGPIHAELRIDQSDVVLIELAARSIGGLCGRALRFGLLGSSLETVLLRAASGRSIRGLSRQDPGVGVMMIPIPRRGTLKAVSGLQAAESVPGITSVDISIPLGAYVLPIPEGDRYLGFIFAQAETPSLAEQALRSAHALMSFEIAESDGSVELDR